MTILAEGCLVEQAVFINYRGKDSHSYGALIYTELTRQFGKDQVFLDSESIPAGADFVQELLDRVRSARVLLAVIGPRWLTITNPTGHRRIDDPGDWIRRELAEAFASGVRVIPILTEQTAMPVEADLPTDIAALSRCQYRRLRHREPTADLTRIVSDLIGLDSALAESARQRAGATVAVTSTATDEVSGSLIQANTLRVYADGRFVDPDPLILAAQRLATSVGRQWTEEAGYRSLLRPEPLRLRWSTTDRPVAPGELSDRPVRSHGDRHELVEMFRALPHRRLVILGAPGAGKTVLALLLVLALLDELADNEPVPVLLSASSWNPREEHLHTWLVRRLAEEYPGLRDERTYGPNAALRLVTGGRILPIIDGLDETPEGLHAAALESLDRGSAGNHPLVVTCRTTAYVAAVETGGTVLSRAAVVEIAPADPVDVISFLESAGPSAHRRWQPVLDRLRTMPATPVARVLTSPLMVALARTVYTDPSHDPAELLDPTRFAEPTTIERHLLDSFVSAAYHQQPEVPGRTWSSQRDRYTAEQARRWLRFLAAHLDRLDTRDLAWWELAHAVRPRTRGLLAALTSSLFAAIAGFVADGAANSTVDVPGYILWFGLPPFVAFRRGYAPRPLHIELTSHATARRFLRRWLAGFAIGFTLGVAYGLSYPLALIAGLIAGLTLASYAWWSIPTDVTQVSTPAVVLRRERTATAAYGLILGLAFGAIVGLVYGFAANLTLSAWQSALAGVATSAAIGVWGYLQYGRAVGLLYGLISGLVAGLTAGSAYAGPIKNPVLLGLVYGLAFGLTIGYGGVLSRAWGVFLSHRTWLAFRARLPWRLMGFLDDARRRGILRQAGGVYQFRHALLQDHLAQPHGAEQHDSSPDIPQQRRRSREGSHDTHGDGDRRRHGPRSPR